jgi:hypothetical protein
MFLYKSDVSMLRVLQPARMQDVMNNSFGAAEKNIKHATYGVVMQVDGKIVGVMSVGVVNDISHVTGAYSIHPESSLAHRDVVREMLEMFIVELGGKTAVARVVETRVDASRTAEIFTQCGFVMRSSTTGEIQLDYGM